MHLPCWSTVALGAATISLVHANAADTTIMELEERNSISSAILEGNFSSDYFTKSSRRRLSSTSCNGICVALPTHEVEEMYWAAYLSEIVYYPDWVQSHKADMQGHNGVSFDTLEFWRDEPDASLVAKLSDVDVCYGVFRGTGIEDGDETMKDTYQNIDSGTATMNSCTVRRGWRDAYYNSYRSEFDAAITQCRIGCPNCKVILTGHSQGGAIAQVTSLAYTSLWNSMKVMSFAGPKAIFPGCSTSKINPNRHYRFITVDNEDLGNFYDIVPMSSGYGATHYGTPILLGNHDVKASALQTNEDRTRTPNGFSIHLVSEYVSRVKDVLDEHLASREAQLTIERVADGKRCGYSDECQSGRCEGYAPPFHCRPKLELLETCNEDSDCLSGRCSVRFSSASMVCVYPNGKVPNGGPCDYGSHCESGRCEGWTPPYTCRATLRRGKSCNENSDCTSGKCSWGKCK